MLNKVIQKYKLIPAPAKASLWFAICSVIQKGVLLITVPLFTRLLTTEQYGEFSVYQSWYQIISIFATLNLSFGVFNNGMTKYPNDRSKYMSSMQALSTIVTLLLFCVYLPFKSYINELTGLSTLVTVVIFAECLATPALAFWSARQRYEFKYIALVGVTIGVAFSSVVFGFVAVNLTEEKGVARILSAALVNICIGLFFYILNVARGKKLFSKEYWSFALKFNLPLVPHYLSQIALVHSNRIMIERMFGETEVAIYSVAYSFAMIMNIVTNSINSSYVPWTYQKLKENDLLPLKRTTSILIVSVAILSLLPVLVAPELMWIIAPAEYSIGVWLIPPLSVCVYFTFLYCLFGNIIFYFEKTKYIMVFSVAIAILNIVFNYFALPQFGFLVSGYVTMICYGIYTIAYYLLMRKLCKEKLEVKSVYQDGFVLRITIAYLLAVVIIICFYKLVLIRYILLLCSLFIVVLKRKKLLEFINVIKTKKEV